MIDKRPYLSNKERIQKEEEELAALMNQTPDTEEVEGEEKEEVQEEEPATKEEKTFKKRYGDLRAYMQKKEKEWEAKFEQLSTQLKETDSLPASEEEIKTWIDEHPTVSRIVQGIAEGIAKKQIDSIKEELGDIREAREKNKKESAFSAIRKAHPDFDDISASDEFHDWAEEQPKWVQDSVYENDEDPKAVIRVLDLYKVDKGLTKGAKKEKEKDAAKLVPRGAKLEVDETNQKGTFSESQVSRMSDKEYVEKEAEIQAAMRSGKFIYDISGGAR